jgi:hypothetical protein
VGSGMLNKGEIKIGDEVALANPHVIGGGIRMVVKGLTAVEKLVYCEGGPFGYGLYHVANLKGYKKGGR